MTTLLNICVVLAWFVYLADTDMFISSRGSTLDQIIRTTNEANELVCFRLCKKTFGCNVFSFSEGHCDLAKGIIANSGSGLLYTRLGTQSSNASVTRTPETTTPGTKTPVTTTPGTTNPVTTTPETTTPGSTTPVTTTPGTTNPMTTTPGTTTPVTTTPETTTPGTTTSVTTTPVTTTPGATTPVATCPVSKYRYMCTQREK